MFGRPIAKSHWGTVPESRRGLGVFDVDLRGLRWAGEARTDTVYGAALSFFSSRK
jgi:hypothetical protein